MKATAYKKGKKLDRDTTRSVHSPRSASLLFLVGRLSDDNDAPRTFQQPLTLFVGYLSSSATS